MPVSESLSSMNTDVISHNFITTINLIPSTTSSDNNVENKEKLIIGTNCGIIIIVQAKQVILIIIFIFFMKKIKLINIFKFKHLFFYIKCLNF